MVTEHPCGDVKGYNYHVGFIDDTTTGYLYGVLLFDPMGVP